MTETQTLIVVSTNRGQKQQLSWNGQTVDSGIYKYPVPEGILLNGLGVQDDSVIDQKYHGGLSKACYLYSLDHYDFWKPIYPDLNWSMGMFGENLTIQGFNESICRVGDVYEIGDAIIKLTEPRQPCFKLGIRFQDQGILKTFVRNNYSGSYASVLQSGLVRPNDRCELIERNQGAPSVAEVFSVLYGSINEKTLIDKIIHCSDLSEQFKQSIKKKRAQR